MEFSLLGTYLLSLLTLTFLEIVLGVDNLVFIAVISNRLPKDMQMKVRRLGLLFAMVTRLILLAAVFWLTKFRANIVTIHGVGFSIRDLILLGGGLFLLYKSTQEIHHDVNKVDPEQQYTLSTSLMSAVAQIGILDIVFSIDSVVTAIGMTPYYSIMAIAIIIAIAVMFTLSEVLTEFINENPTVKMLALSFLLMVGTVLVADGFHFEIPRQYLYFAITFSLFVEMLNILAKKKQEQHLMKQEKH